MIKIEATHRELFDGNIDGGITMWWEKDSNVVLYPTWDHRASGKEFSEVQQTWTSSDLLTYFMDQGWNDEYKIVNVEEIKLAM